MFSLKTSIAIKIHGSIDAIVENDIWGLNLNKSLLRNKYKKKSGYNNQGENRWQKSPDFDQKEEKSEMMIIDSVSFFIFVVFPICNDNYSYNIR